MHNKDYPLNPPDFMMLTPNGRFLTGNKICLTNTGYHSNDWSPMWTINAILTGFLSIMLDDVDNGLAHIRRSSNERQKLAEDSVDFNKQNFPNVIKKFTRFLDDNGNPK